MVALNDMAHLQQLYGELRLLEQAVHNFDEGGLITALTVSPPPPEPDQIPPMEIRSPVTITTTEDMHYPDQMVTMIKYQLNTRITGIKRELTELGLDLTE